MNNYYDDLLQEPIESELVESAPKPFPDRFRPYLFNRPLFILNADPITNNITSANFVKFWNLSNLELTKFWEMTDQELTDKIITKINKYTSSSIDNLARSLAGKIQLRLESRYYYNNLYDMIDIIVARNDRKSLIELLSQLMAVPRQEKPIGIRIVIYVAFHICRLLSNSNRFIAVTRNKCNEFLSDETHVGKSFLLEELYDYIQWMIIIENNQTKN